MQQTLSGCAFCNALPGSEHGDAFTWGKDDRGSHPICVNCAIQAQANPDDRDHHACEGCVLVVDTLVALTRFDVELANLDGTTTPLCPL